GTEVSGELVQVLVEMQEDVDEVMDQGRWSPFGPPGPSGRTTGRAALRPRASGTPRAGMETWAGVGAWAGADMGGGLCSRLADGLPPRPGEGTILSHEVLDAPEGPC